MVRLQTRLEAQPLVIKDIHSAEAGKEGIVTC